MSDAAIQCIHMNHLNVVVEGFEASVERFGNVLGARFNADMPQEEWHAGLINVGGVLFEVFSPKQFLLNARYGPHYVGVEYQIPDVSDARRAVLDKGMRIVRDIGLAFHTHPADSFGVSLEFYHKSFHAQENPTWREPFLPLEYWRDEHPMGYAGLKRYSVAVVDLAAATNFFQGFLGASVLYETPRPAVGAKAVGLGLGDSVVEIMTPTGAGLVGDHLRHYGDGIRSTVFEVANLDTARRHFADRGIAVEAGDADDAFAVSSEATCGVRFEFSE